MNKLSVLGIAVAAWVSMAGAAQAQLLGKEAKLWTPIKSLSADAHYQDHERFPVGLATTPEGAASEGTILGTTRPGNTTLGGAGNKWFSGGKALVIVDNKAHIQTAGGRMDDIPGGSGYAARFLVPVSEIQFEVVTGAELDIEVEGLYLRRSLAQPQRFHVGPGNSTLKLGTNGVFWDTVQIRAVKDGPGWGLDNIGIGGVMFARPVVCRQIE